MSTAIKWVVGCPSKKGVLSSPRGSVAPNHRFVRLILKKMRLSLRMGVRQPHVMESRLPTTDGPAVLVARLANEFPSLSQETRLAHLSRGLSLPN